jgi:hypothetical protein
MNAKRTTQKADQNRESLAAACVASCHKLAARLNQAREAVLNEFADTLAAHRHLLQLALNEAEALAWQTEVPALVFADLAVEKAQALANWQSRQDVLQHG